MTGGRWDTLGAAAAGWQAGLILREGNASLDVGPQPDYVGKDLDVIADQLIERYATAAVGGRRSASIDPRSGRCECANDKTGKHRGCACTLERWDALCTLCDHFRV